MGRLSGLLERGAISFNLGSRCSGQRSSLEAPPKCSGLPVARHSSETLQSELGDNFILAEAVVEDHVTPSWVKQNFIFCRFIKRA